MSSSGVTQPLETQALLFSTPRFLPLARVGPKNNCVLMGEEEGWETEGD